MDFERFEKMLLNSKLPVQIIWAGKPYPTDYGAISVFDRIAHLAKQYSNCSILIGYELKLSKMLKQGADLWISTPRLFHEASGTSGMTAAMNGTVNASTADGWFPEFIRNGENGFLLPPADVKLAIHEQDVIDNRNLMELLESVIIPMYYNEPEKWLQIVKNGISEIVPAFDSGRMAKEYYEKLYLPLSYSADGAETKITEMAR